MFVDLWICNHFKVLPTDERFQRLHEDQKNLLFVGYLEHPTSEQLHEAYNRRSTEVVTENDADNFKKLGYSEEQVQRIKSQLEVAGLA